MQIVTTGDGSKTVFSERYQQTYHSTHGAVTESQTVFIEGAGLADRLARAGCEERSVRVLEIGFGLGLNFLLSADLALQHRAQLQYVAIEHDPVSASIMRELDYAKWLVWPSLAENLQKWLEQLEAQTLGLTARREETQPGNGISLVVQESMDANSLNSSEGFDVVYLDAFSPDTNAECWSQSALDSLYGSMKPNGILATYSAKGSVRRSLETAGFAVTKRPGPPGKREVLKAEKTA